MKPRILVVEDEPNIADTITYALATDGFDPLWCATAQAALDALAQGSFALAILDVGLPDRNGFDLLRDISQHHTLPVIFLTARRDEIDRIVGLELGADDYVTKPFSPRELTARVRTILRRVGRAGASAEPADPPAADAASSSLPLRIDEERQRIAYFGQPLPLSRYEFRVLKVLIQRPGRIYSRDELMQLCWDEPDTSFDRTVDAHIKSLRAKMRQIRAEPDPIRTSRGIGYALRDDWPGHHGPNSDHAQHGG